MAALAWLFDPDDGEGEMEPGEVRHYREVLPEELLPGPEARN